MVAGEWFVVHDFGHVAFEIVERFLLNPLRDEVLAAFPPKGPDPLRWCRWNAAEVNEHVVIVALLTTRLRCRAKMSETGELGSDRPLSQASGQVIPVQLQRFQ